MKLENSFLADKFGKKYWEWSAKTPMFIPKFRLFQKSSIPFSIKLVWKNEYPGIVSTLSSLWFISFLRLQFLVGKITISLPLIFFAIMILVFGLSSRYLKHRTQFFPKMG
jgi:protein-S-isoprenylcysteine O-methyltransferase Ste14